MYTTQPFQAVITTDILDKRTKVMFASKQTVTVHAVDSSRALSHLVKFHHVHKVHSVTPQLH